MITEITRVGAKEISGRCCAIIFVCLYIFLPPLRQEVKNRCYFVWPLISVTFINENFYLFSYLLLVFFGLVPLPKLLFSSTSFTFHRATVLHPHTFNNYVNSSRGILIIRFCWDFLILYFSCFPFKLFIVK